MFLNRSHRRKLVPGAPAQRRQRNSIDYATLEQRLALTTFFVNSAVDDASGTVDGQISLREAITAANTNAAFGDAPAGQSTGDVIRFNSSLSNSTLTLTAGQISITDGLTIQGGALNITIDGNGGDRIFEITATERVAMGRLTFTGGSAAQGGAINTTSIGSTVVLNSTFDGNVATGVGGGAIYNAVGNLYLTGSTFTSNIANGASGSGGAILSASGTTVVRGGEMLSNVANRAGGAIEVIDGRFFTYDAQVGDVGQGNIAGPSGSAAPGNGGGLHVTGTARVVITGGEFNSNVAASEGGGLWNQVGSTMFIRANALVTNNLANGDAADNGGGGIFNNGGDLRVTLGSTISANGATGSAGSGGGIFSVDGSVLVIDSTIDGNAAARAGGGIEMIDGFLSLSNSVLSDNDAGITYAAAPGSGGGLHVTGTASTVINSSEVSGNVAASQGSGLWNQEGANMFIRNGSTIIDNVSTVGGSTGGGVYNRGYLAAIDSFFQRNSAGEIGGGIQGTSTARTIVENTDFIGNSASTFGGGIYNDGFARVEDSSFNNNVVGFNGGAIYTNTGGTTIENDNSFVGNLPNNTN